MNNLEDSRNYINPNCVGTLMVGSKIDTQKEVPALSGHFAQARIFSKSICSSDQLSFTQFNLNDYSVNLSDICIMLLVSVSVSTMVHTRDMIYFDKKKEWYRHT